MEIIEQINTSIKIRKIWAMPSAHTFTIQPIKELVFKYCINGKGWIDPFAGENSPAELTNDLNPDKPAKYHMDALDFMISCENDFFDGILYDPPYSFTQAKECYDSFGKDLYVEHDSKPTMMDYWANLKKVSSQKIKVGGLAICCGWNSNGFGKGNGFKMLEVLLVAHGGSKNDTIITVERKFQSSLF